MAEALLAQERHDYIMAQRAEADYHLQQLMQGPSLDVYSAGSGGGSSGGGAGSTAGSGSDCQNIVASEDGVGVGDKDSSESQQQIEASSNINSSTKSISSFATITQVEKWCFLCSIGINLLFICACMKTDGRQLPSARPGGYRSQCQ